VSKKRIQAERRGRTAETLAGLWLMAKGYRLIAQRARTPFGEVDLVALKGRTLAIVEVKARRTRDQALQSIPPRQRDRIARAGLDVARKFRLPHASIRLDLMIIRPWAWPEHVRNAWRADERD
jgi:putative endonuclease